MVHASTVLRTAEEKDWRQIVGLMNGSRRLHSHLDWQNPKTWLGSTSFLSAWVRGQLAGLLAIPPEVSGVAWLRLAAVEEGLDGRWIMNELWREGRSILIQQGVMRVATLSTSIWLEATLADWGFAASDLVVVMIRERGTVPPCVTGGPSIRAAHLKDLSMMTRIDNAAFTVPWSQSTETLRCALGQVGYATVAEVDGQVVGFQISTGGERNAHMARLAVHPMSQKRGIGRALVCDMIRHFESKSTLTISLNTQEDNHTSLNLYRSLGFEQSGDSHMLWQLWLCQSQVYN